jgi:prophage regulatory protein
MSHTLKYPCRVEPGFLRISHIVGSDGLLPMSKSTWWKGVKEGRYPQPVKLSANVTAWRADDIWALMESLSDTTGPLALSLRQPEAEQ